MQKTKWFGKETQQTNNEDMNMNVNILADIVAGISWAYHPPPTHYSEEQAEQPPPESFSRKISISWINLDYFRV